MKEAMMEKTFNEPRSLLLSTRLYRALLAVYPSEFRQAYGGPMLQVFRDGCRRALRESGATGLISLWARTLLDVVQTAIEEHAQRGVDMSKEKFIKLSGWALILGGLAEMLGWLASTRPDYDRYNAHSLPIDRYVNVAELPLLVMGMLLLSVGFTGLLVRYGKDTGAFGRSSLGLAIVSGMVSAVGMVGLGIYDSDPWWSLFFWGLTFQFVGAALFGIVCLRRRVLPRWNALPLFAGVWIPLFVVVVLIVEQFTGTWVEWPEWVFFAIWLLSLAGLAGLGFQLQSDAQPAGTATAVA
jgi:hypothetical protein